MKTINKITGLKFSMNSREFLFDCITYLFISLFIYTATAKILTFQSFVTVLGRSPLLGSVNVLVACLIPTVEIALSILLMLNRTKRAGLLLSVVLILIFTVYLTYMVVLGGQLPCMCGGVISSMTWKQHIWFNLGFIMLGITGTIINRPGKC